MRQTREQKRKRKLAQRQAPMKSVATVTHANVLDLFAPEVVAIADAGCCLATIGRRSTGKRLVWIVEGEPCAACERVFMHAVQFGLAPANASHATDCYEVGFRLGQADALCCSGALILPDERASQPVGWVFEKQPCRACAVEVTTWLRDGFVSILSTDQGSIG